MKIHGYPKAGLLATVALAAQAGAAHADTVIVPFTVMTVTATSPPPDSGSITVPDRATLRLSDSAGGFTLGNVLNLEGRGVPILVGLSSRAAVETILAGGSTITASGNIFVLGNTSISAFASPPVSVGSGPPANGTLRLTGNITGAGIGPVSLTLGSSAIVVSGLISDGPTASLAMRFTGQTLTGVNTYSGGTSGSVRVSSDASLGAASGPLTGLTLTLAGNLTSTRSLTNVTFVAEAGTSSQFAGQISGGATVSGAGTVALSGPMISGGQLTVAGPGTAVLATPVAGAFPPIPNVLVSGGTAVFANAGLFATRQGRLEIAGGTVRTDGSFNTVNISSFVQSGGTLQLRQLSATTSEALNVQVAISGTGGDATMQVGSTLQILAAPGYTPRSGDQYTVITSRQLNGEFAQIIGPPGFFVRPTYTRTIGASSLVLRNIGLSDFATSASGAAAAQALMRGGSAAAPAAFFTTASPFASFSGDDTRIGSFLDQLTPQRFQVLRNIAFNQATLLATAVDGWSVAPDSDDGRWRAFGGGMGTLAAVGARSGVDHASYDSAGAVAGLDHATGDNARVGFLLGYHSSDASLDAAGSRAVVRGITPALFATYETGALKLRGLAAYSFNDYSTRRRILIGAFDQTARGAPSGHSVSVGLGARYDLLTRGDLRVGPMLDATYTHLKIDAFDETGAGDASLRIGDQKASSLRTRLGAAATLGTGTLQAELALAWQHEFNAARSAIATDFTAAGSGGFVTTPSSLAGDAAYGSFKLTGNVTQRVSGFLGYQLQASSRESAHGFFGGLKIAF